MESHILSFTRKLLPNIIHFTFGAATLMTNHVANSLQGTVLFE